MKKPKINIESYGCTMNHGEARSAAQRLSSLGYSVIDDHRKEEADKIVLFTCDVITTTENRMWRRMEEITSSGKELIVAGCLAAISPDEIRRRFPDAVILDSMGLQRMGNGLLELAGDLENGEREPEFFTSGERLDTIVPISTGCAGNCSYCITKIARGDVVSYQQDDIIDRIRKGVQSGRKEVLLTSQDSAAYGYDLMQTDLGDLLRNITRSIDKDHRIRVGMMNPTLALQHIDSILDGFDDRRIFKFFHIPIQSGSNEILKKMRRGYTVETYLELLEKIRSRFKDATISTDLIIGFPSETDGQHDESIDVLRKISPDVLNITRFSSRPGTDAEKMQGQIKGWLMKERSRQITLEHSRIVTERLQERLGHHPNCLVTEIGKEGTLMARDSNYTPIVIKGERELLGSLVDIKTTRIGPSYLVGGDDWRKA